jgi:hypothetical protein
MAFGDVLAEQRRYYEQRAGEYEDWWSTGEFFVYAELSPPAATPGAPAGA